jgi:hypothetical protein
VRRASGKVVQGLLAAEIEAIGHGGDARSRQNNAIRTIQAKFCSRLRAEELPFSPAEKVAPLHFCIVRVKSLDLPASGLFTFAR